MPETKIGGITAELKLNSTKFSRGINKANKSLRGIRKGMGSLKNSLLGLAGIGGLGLLAREVVSTLATFEQSMANVKAIIGATESEMRKLTDTARKMGAETKFSASEAAEGMQFLARAGFTTSQILETIEPTLNLAAAGSIELGEAADIASNVLSGFGLQAEQLGRVVDVMAKTTSSANTDIRQMGDALKFVAPVARGFNVSIEETSAAIGILSNAGLQSTLAGTGLRKIFTTLATASGSLREMMGGLTVESDGLTAVLKQLRASGISTTEIMVEFGERAGPAFNVLVGAVDQVETLNGALLKATGTGLQQAKIKLDTLQGSFLELKSGVQELILKLGDSGLGGHIRSLVNSLRDMARELNNVLAINTRLGEDTIVNKFIAVRKEIDELNKKLLTNKKIINDVDLLFGRDAIIDENIELEKRIKLLNAEAKKLENVIVRNKKLAEDRKKETERLKALRMEAEKLASAAKALRQKREEEKLNREGKPIEASERPFNSSIGGGLFAGLGLSDDALLESLRIAEELGKASQEAAKRTAQVFKDVTDPLNKAKEKFSEFSKSVESFRFSKQVQGMDKPFQFLPDSTIDSAKALKAVELGLIDIGAIADSVIPKISATKEQIKALAFFDDPLDQLAKLIIQIEDVGKAMGKSASEIEDAILRAEKSFDLGKDKFSDFEKSLLDGLENIRSGFEAGLTDALADALDDTANFRDRFIDILKVIRNEIIRTFIVKQLLNAIGGIGGLFGAGINLEQQFGNGVTASDLGLADGGRAKAGNAFIVGEEGPELFVPGQTGTVIPNDMLGGGVNVTLQVSTGVAETVEAELIRLLPKIQETFETKIADSRLRGGQFSRAITGG